MSRPTHDNYPTPPWAIRAILAAVLPEAMNPAFRRNQPFAVLDPCCGDNGFLAELARLFVPLPRRRIVLHGYDIRQEAVDATRAIIDNVILNCPHRTFAGGVLGDYLNIRRRDYVAEAPGCGDGIFDLVITNPPYTHPELGAEVIRRIVEHALARTRLGGHVVMLLRAGWLGDGESKFGRASWLRSCPPDVLMLDRRPSFSQNDGRRSTDSSAYAAVRWVKGRSPTDRAEFRSIITAHRYVHGVLDGMDLSTYHIPYIDGDGNKAGQADRPRKPRKKTAADTSDTADTTAGTTADTTNGATE